MKTRNQSTVPNQDISTKRGQDAWVKNAVAKGMDEAAARELVTKMASAQESKTKIKQKEPAITRVIQKPSTPPSEGDFFMDVPLPPPQVTQIVATPAKKEKAASLTVEINQFPLWPDVMRSLPNEILRSALFNARNRSNPRVMMKNEPIAIIGDGRITYRGEELRQDDETVWLQLVHLARHHVAGQLVEFTAYSFCKEISWPIGKRSYDRLKESFRRMQATGLDVYSKRLDRGVSLSMIPFFEYVDSETQKSLPRWRVRIAPELVDLFGNDHYTRIEWEQRLQLPDGLATWLHGYLASHRIPHPIKIDTIALGSGMNTVEKTELRRLIKRALTNLVDCGFLLSFEIARDLVTVKRAPNSHSGLK
ncbi:MAG: TrfA family protein [Rhodoferax sp.]|nr:TrfA family protein [Betaproteobacteria bacterium]NCN97440.1 TrfA family protein [Rhodoferax sp.]OIP21307.1 MAG: hypothetical protein AUK50_01675 [Comamonadaceae bacterium CG2_30_57_122]PIZ23100.1 MAG: TrfA family protein [Comamonadaceae bacterium CG_4_10_14_0_8_um_filter_57_29]NCP81760.1 TrfA family protein [Rhodoferax sp.]